MTVTSLLGVVRACRVVRACGALRARVVVRGGVVDRAWRSVIALLIAAGVAVAGCSSAPASSTPKVAHARVSLRLQMRDDSVSHGKPEVLTCAPAGGGQPATASACSVLLKLRPKNPFAPISGGRNCPMLLRSNRKILVTGSWFGVKVHRLVVDGGCDIALFDRLMKILNWVNP